MAILIRLALSDGSVIECEPERVMYTPADRVIVVTGCGDEIFSSGFEENGDE